MDPKIQWEEGSEQVTCTLTLTCKADGSCVLESGEFSQTCPSEEEAVKLCAAILHQGIEASKQ